MSARADTVSWKTHRTLNAQPDRFELVKDGMKLAEARKIVTARTRGASGTGGWHEALGLVADRRAEQGGRL